jgi:hypothetical protein
MHARQAPKVGRDPQVCYVILKHVRDHES